MKAVILAGGEGTRLKAVTGEKPKPMVDLLGRPLMEHILLLLKKHGFTEICAAVRYRAEEIMDYFGDGSRLGVHLRYQAESEPLGTAGAVKRCASLLGGGDCLVISGDAACDFDLAALWQRHRAGAAAATLALYRDPEPLRFGLAVTDGADRIRAFIEKPAWERVVSDLVNTGIYVLSPAALEQIPEGREYDFGKDLFPALLQQGLPLLGVPLNGYWRDVGTPLSYYQCCVDALEGRLAIFPGEAFQAPPPEESPAEDPPAAATLDCPCASRAAVMGALSELMLELDADYSDGIRLHDPRYELHIAPLSARSAVRIAVDSRDAEFARSLALSAGELVKALNL